MTRQDLIAFERANADHYRREARRRRKKYPAVADQLERWAEASIGRAEKMRCGPLFGRGAE